MTNRILTEDAWLKALRDDRARLQVQRWGSTSYSTAWNTERRTLEEHLIWLIVRGGFEGEAAGQRMRLGAGDFFWIARGVEHDLRMETHLLPCVVYHIRFTLVRREQHLRLPPHTLVLHDALEMRPYFDMVLREMNFPGSFQDERLRGIFAMLHSTVFMMQSRPQQRGRMFTALQKQRVTKMMEENIHRRVGSRELAAHIGLTRDYFALLFHRTFGMAPREWILRERIRRAADHLAKTSESISSVATRFGYPDLFLFSRQFKRVHGCSPRAYRMGR